MHPAQVTVLSRYERSPASPVEHEDQSTLVRSYVCYPNVAPYVAALYETDSQMATQLLPNQDSFPAGAVAAPVYFAKSDRK
jgi:hypothetical protein